MQPSLLPHGLLAARALSNEPVHAAKCKELIREVDEVSGESLYMMANMPGGHLGASRERLIRDVMDVDSVDRASATEKVRAIAKKNSEGVFMGILPYRVGITVAIVSGWASIPGVFSVPLAKWFNTYFVTTDIPPPEDLQTILECGMWTWGWMEPPLGTVSFFLLCLQYARDQRINIGQKPWTERWKSEQADKLAAAYPQYNTAIVRDYGKCTCFEDDSDDF